MTLSGASRGYGIHRHPCQLFNDIVQHPAESFILRLNPFRYVPGLNPVWIAFHQPAELRHRLLRTCGPRPCSAIAWVATFVSRHPLRPQRHCFPSFPRCNGYLRRFGILTVIEPPLNDDGRTDSGPHLMNSRFSHSLPFP